ncbi:MAG: peptidase M23 [Microbacterium sp. 69-10]|uniref:M23 family metallopeptidase n=1 Tax=Microbacterium sp. 69-10 TaxID=1895783 RepID=UPI000960735B|nr:M23 family metallopeptidase [Microbacterium sp. 69-10]OJU41511.1 MAG: peptidase M23 [Microbacterium sp. 69-10]
MLKKLLGIGLALVFLGPSTALVGVGVLMNPSSTAAATCLSGSLVVGPVPDSLTATTKDGTTVTLNKSQLTHAATIITVGSQTAGVGRPGVIIAIMAALTESSLRMLANTGTYPESADYPNDGNGGDHDSLGLFQMRPQSGWGTVADLMDPNYQARAFFGGPDGPNYPSPRGLLDIPGWQQLDPGEAAQSVEVSAYPDRYQNYQPVAEAIVTALTKSASSNGDGGTEADPTVPETRTIVFPLPEGTWVKTSPFGWRTDPIDGDRRLHAGTDFAAPDGTPILATADGVVVRASYTDTDGGSIVINHTVNGELVASEYHHMWQTGIYVTVGETVTAGQHIGDVGSSGHSTGPHLHFEIHPGGISQPAIDSDVWLTDHHAEGIQPGDTQPATCTANTSTGGQ